MKFVFDLPTIIRVLMYCFFGFTGLRGIFKLITLDGLETVCMSRLDYFLSSIISTLIILLLMGKI